MAQRKVVVVGGGLAGLMTAMKLAEAGHKVQVFSIVPVKRSHSVCAQGGINGAVNLRGEGDSPYLHFEDTITGGDFLNHQPPVMRMAERAPAIIYLLDRMGVPFNRTDEGLLSFRRFGGTLKHRTAYAGATTGQQLLYALDEQCRRFEAGGQLEKYEGWEFIGLIKDGQGRCRGIVGQDMRTMKIESFPADAVVIASGGNGVIFGRSTNSIINTGNPVSICYEQGAVYGNPEMVQIHPTAIPGEDKCRLMSESVRGEGGRLWTPRDPMDGRPAAQIPEADRWYFCEELDPVYGNLLSRDLVSFTIYCVCRIGRGVKGMQQVYLDIGHLHREKGWSRELINDKLGGVLEIYEKFMREDPIDNPMRIYPAVHYTMGGLWVDYEKGTDGATLDVGSPRNQMTSIPGLYAAGECEYQYHGANRLGANALLTCLTGGELAALGVQAYLQKMEVSAEDLPSSARDEARAQRQAEYDGLRQSKGAENPYQLAAELQELMWNNCGIWRLQRDLLATRDRLQELGERADRCGLLDESGWQNQAIPYVRTVKHMVEMSKAIVGGAIIRDESRGAHFKLDTPERDDEKWLVTTKAAWTPGGPEFDLSEKVETNVMAPRPRKYRINQNKVVREIMGADFFEKAGLGKADEAAPVGP
ncbi:MAG: succinate dehydrogenase (quinone) flavoprotein subunit [Fimbriimonadaceae bacterium]|nr:succinate dehydrogenase (quinone) flavoprotein subunit [Fimbriimonadaceae bacterium]QYK56248.1 MAG: succinate dehydrogenase (quinone) flavoprotein subunit [Fimbriimonadaceae bacterium]